VGEVAHRVRTHVGIARDRRGHDARGVPGLDLLDERQHGVLGEKDAHPRGGAPDVAGRAPEPVGVEHDAAVLRRLDAHRGPVVERAVVVGMVHAAGVAGDGHVLNHGMSKGSQSPDWNGDKDHHCCLTRFCSEPTFGVHDQVREVQQHRMTTAFL
jgi:hypothetical protein